MKTTKLKNLYSEAKRMTKHLLKNKSVARNSAIEKAEKDFKAYQSNGVYKA